MVVMDKIASIQQILAELNMEHEAEINEYVQDINYLQEISNSQTMEIQKLNTLLVEYEAEIKRLRGEII